MTDRPLRKHARRKISATVRLRLGGKEAECQSRELGEGGLFVVTDDPLKVGEQIDLEIVLAAKIIIKVRGEVVYSVEKEIAEAEFREPGMGIIFLNLGKEDKAKLSAVIF